MKKQTLSISGMHCASCAANIEKGLRSLDGVRKANVNFASQKAFVEYDESLTDREKLVSKMEKLGFSAVPEEEASRDSERMDREKEMRTLKGLFAFSLALSVPVFMISMILDMWLGIMIPYRNYILLALTTPVQFIVGFRFYKGTYAALRAKTATMDTLVAIGTSASYFYSIFVMALPEILGDAVYFETSAVLITFIIFGRWLEAIAKGRPPRR